ncbi:hypothetical protein MUP56_01855 [Patescibacteria group bacterium]|nr:hypothetical protein [Patescibacteria group bacterium]
MPKERKLRVGDPLPYTTSVFDKNTGQIVYAEDGLFAIARGVCTIVEIVELPQIENPEELTQFMRTVMDRLNPKTQGSVGGKNLQDDPQFEKRADPHVIYITEY